jgi:nitrite reductase/ring-hydroxylating ferredoxin subunit
MRLFGKKLRQDADGFWETGISAETITPDTMTPITINRIKIVVTQIDDEIIAFARTCPHAAADLSQGDLHRGRVICPDHGWKFDIRTGRVLWPSDEQCRLKQYHTKIIDNLIWISVS